MDTLLSCPQCRRSLAIPEVYLGKKIRCPGCSTVIATEKPAADPAPSLAEDPYPAVDTGPFTFHVKALRDPEWALHGVYKADLSRKGLRLSPVKKKSETGEVFLPVGTPAHSLDGSKFAVDLGGREVTLAVSQWNLYQPRLARDLASFLSGKGPLPVRDDYAIPTYLTVLALLPIGVGAVGLLGGAIGGGIAGGLAGGLISANFAIVRRERWPTAVRVFACLSIGGASYVILGLAFWTLASLSPQPAAPFHPIAPPPPVVAAIDPPPPVVAAIAPPPPVVVVTPPVPLPAPPPILPAIQPARPAVPPARPAVTRVTGWGTAEDPLGDCRISARGNKATITIPGVVHELTPPPGQPDAPRILKPIEGDFVAEVAVVGDDDIADPPAPPHHIAFHGAGLLLWGDSGDFLRLERASFVRNGQVVRYILMEHLRSNTPAWENNTPYDGGPVSLRLERRDGRITASFRVGNGEWQPAGGESFFTPNVSIGVAAVNTASAPYTARFEDLKINKP